MPDIVDFHPLFIQLQNRYPSGSLVSELLQVYEGSFVVRAIVEVGGVTLATSLAAAATVEQAEDQARLRVLRLLGIHATNALGSPGLPAASYDLRTFSLPSTLEHSRSPLNETAGRSTLDPGLNFEQASQPSEVAALSADGRLPEFSSIQPPLPDSDHFEPVLKSNPSPTPTASLPLPGGTPGERKKTGQSSASPNVPEPLPPVDSEPMDLSELITLTDIEIQRVGWSRKQGHDYLMETYAKKRRADLDQEQLMEFLHYLRALPSRYESAFRE